MPGTWKIPLGGPHGIVSPSARLGALLWDKDNVTPIPALLWSLPCWGHPRHDREQGMGGQTPCKHTPASKTCFYLHFKSNHMQILACFFVFFFFPGFSLRRV